MNAALWCNKVSDSTKRWGIFKLSIPPVLGFAYLSANFGLLYALPGGLAVTALSIWAFQIWDLPRTKLFVSAFLCAVFLSWCLFELLPLFISDNPTFLKVVGGILYILIWSFVDRFAGIRNLTPEEELREILDHPDNISAKQRIESARRKQAHDV